MPKWIKILIFIIAGFFSIVVIFNIFFAPHANALAPINNEQNIVSLLASWLPMIIFAVFYILFLRMLNRLISIGDRIAIAIEKAADILQVKLKQD